MTVDNTRARVPIDWLPAGLISWYAPDGRPLALVTSWMALFSGAVPRLRAGWPGRRDARSRFWPGGAFVLNIPGEESLPRIRELVNRGLICFDVIKELDQETTCGLQVSAPRLQACPIQVECEHGQLMTDGYEPDVVGEISLIHRPDKSLDPFMVPDLCALNPLNPTLRNPAS